MTETYHPRAARSDELVDPSEFESTDLSDAGQTPRAALYDRVRNLRSPLRLGSSGLVAVLARILVLTLSILALDALLPLREVLAQEGRLTPALAFMTALAVGGTLFHAAHRGRWPGAYFNIYLAVLVASLLSLGGLFIPQFAPRIGLPFLCGYGAASAALLGGYALFAPRRG